MNANGSLDRKQQAIINISALTAEGGFCPLNRQPNLG
jgi:hypothetical protein